MKTAYKFGPERKGTGITLVSFVGSPNILERMHFHFSNTHHPLSIDSKQQFYSYILILKLR